MEARDSLIVVVDDNKQNRDILSRKLSRRGYQVEVAEDGKKALGLIGALPVDLVILDIMMPGIDGLEVLQRLRQTHSSAELPIIMASAKSDTQDIVLTARLGANDHIAKPFDSDVLLAKVEALLIMKKAIAPAARSSAEGGEIGIGSVIAGKFRLDEEIGSGTFGAVYKARHLELDSQVAVKVLRTNLKDQDNSAERFRREGVAACRVRHPNAVQISDYGVSESGLAYLVMELLEGWSLGDEMDQHGQLPPDRAVGIVRPVCEVLAEAHANDLVHRDIKPDNIFLHRGVLGEVIKVLDFGIAKLVGEAVVQNNLTADGWILGTPAYMAPERLVGDSYDGRADVYSVGVLLFELLAGLKPFVAKNNDPMSLVHQHTHQPPPELRQVDPSLPVVLEKLVGRALRKDASARPDAATLASELAAFAPAGESSSAANLAGEARVRDHGDAALGSTGATRWVKPKTGVEARLLGRLIDKIKGPRS